VVVQRGVPTNVDGENNLGKDQNPLSIFSALGYCFQDPKSFKNDNRVFRRVELKMEPSSPKVRERGNVSQYWPPSVVHPGVQVQVVEISIGDFSH
jgi:hypothetical protein